MSIVLALSLAAQAQNLNWDFETGSREGWVVVQRDDYVPLTYAAQNTATISITPPGDDEFLLAVEPWLNRDSEHDTLLVRSPEFLLDASVDITLHLSGGQSAGEGTSTLPASVSDLASHTSVDDGVHAMGVGIRLVSTDAYIATASRSVHGQDYEFVTIPASSLASFHGQAVSIDLFDSYGGGWGWVAIDDVSAGEILPPTLSVTGSCPGPVDVRIDGLPPGGTVALAKAASTGTTIIPRGPCAGTAIGLDAASVKLLKTFTADAAGTVFVTPTLPSAACGAVIQAIDLTLCLPSNSVAL